MTVVLFTVLGVVVAMAVVVTLYRAWQRSHHPPRPAHPEHHKPRRKRRKRHG